MKLNYLHCLRRPTSIQYDAINKKVPFFSFHSVAEVNLRQILMYHLSKMNNNFDLQYLIEQ